MLLKTHLAITLFFALLFSSGFYYPVFFIAIALLATILPDIDTFNSYIGRKARIISKILSFFTKHRGFFHSFSCSVLFTILLLFISPFIASAFFAGYSIHILADSFTVEGVELFWPLRKKVNGRIKTSGITEKLLFCLFVILDSVYLFAYLF